MSTLNPPRPIVGRDSMGLPVFASRKSLEERISTALAWGAPDHESTGMNHAELLQLLQEARDEIRRLKNDRR